MKKQITALLLVFAMVIALSGCKSTRVDTAEVTNTDSSSFSESSEEIKSTEGQIAESSEVAPESTATPDAEESNTSTMASIASDNTNKTQSQSTEKPVFATEAPAKTEQYTQSQQTEAPTQKPAEETKPTQTEKPTETPTEPTFDIDYWISYAKSYAESVGLTLDSSATECWDNPIPAGAKVTSLKDNIQSRMNRYSRQEDVTAIWVWAESNGNGTYDLYVGYA